MTQSFIERQFPVSKVSKESYKERKAGSTQTLTGLGKWWGRKPLILVRAAIIGCLMPASNNPKKDNDIFLKILSMDETGLEARFTKSMSAPILYETVSKNEKLKSYLQFFDITGSKPKLSKDAPKKEISLSVFRTMGYDFKLSYCLRPEHVRVENEEVWREINHHLQTKANSIEELIQQLSERRFGRNVIVGDCFCGGGSIPFEAARIGCNTFGSDLNPVAGLLTWASLHLCGASPEKLNEVNAFMSKVYEDVNQQIQNLGIETNDAGHRAFAYLYCNEAKCPECGKMVPLLPSRIIGKGTRTIVDLIEEGDGYSFKVTSGVEAKRMKEYESGTIGSSGLLCPHCGKSTPVSVLRHDGIEKGGNTVYGLRKWDINEFEARREDVFHERLYAIKYERPDGSRYYCAPSKRDLSNEKKIQNIVKKNITEWQIQEIVPSMGIESGMETDRLSRERGWGYWHQLFNPRQSLMMVLLQKSSLRLASTNEEIAAALLGLNRCLV